MIKNLYNKQSVVSVLFLWLLDFCRFTMRPLHLHREQVLFHRAAEKRKGDEDPRTIISGKMSMLRLSMHWLVTLALIRIKSINFVPADLIRNVISRLIDFQTNRFVVDVRKKSAHTHPCTPITQPIKLLSCHNHNMITCLFGVIAACSEWERESGKHIFISTSAFLWRSLNRNASHADAAPVHIITPSWRVPEFHASRCILAL